MTIRSYLVAATAVSMVALAACNPVPLQRHHSSDSSKGGFLEGFNDGWNDEDSGTKLNAVSTLICPEHQGELTRTAQAADGKSCDYSGPNDETVRLSLLALGGQTPTDAIAPLKAQLKTLIPPPPPGPVNVEATKGENGDKAKVDLPFLHVDADGNKANVKILGATIHADDDKADIKASSGSKTAIVHAGLGGAEVIAENVGKSNVSLVYVLAGDKVGTSGYHAVGYVARGPVEGPLVVGEFHSKAEHQDGDNRHSDLGRLIDRNVKG